MVSLLEELPYIQFSQYLASLHVLSLMLSFLPALHPLVFWKSEQIDKLRWKYMLSLESSYQLIISFLYFLNK